MNDNIKEIGTDYSIVHSQTEHMKVMTRNELRVTGEPLNNIISDKEQGKGDMSHKDERMTVTNGTG